MSPQPWRRVTRAEANKGRLKTSKVRAGKPLAFGSLPLRRYVDSRRAADAPIAQPTGIPRGRGRVMTRGRGLEKRFAKRIMTSMVSMRGLDDSSTATDQD